MRNSRTAGCLLFLAVTWPSFASTGIATCEIEIEDVYKGSTYRLEQKFDFKRGGVAQVKHFDTPDNDYACRLVFFELKKGSMISCEYKKDNGHTFFQSDRSVLEDEMVTNNLAFRHQSTFIILKTRCK